MEGMTDGFKSTWQRTWPFFGVMIAFWSLSLSAWIGWGYHPTFEWANGFRWAWLDTASLYIFTHLADGLILPALLFLFLWRKDPALAITAFLAIMFTGLVAQFGKLVLFTDWHRPPVVFADNPAIQIFHPTPPTSRSFPSGHATSAAAGGFFFALLLADHGKWLPTFAGLFSVFIGFTRVIIGVHFPGDVFIGSLIGSVGALACLVYIYPWLRRGLNHRRAMNHEKVGRLVVGVAVLVIIGQLLHLYSEY